MDELVQHLVEELSFEGPYGVSWDQLEQFVRAFYAQQDAGDLVRQQHHHHQLVDRPFVQWVLSNLLALDQIDVGQLVQLEQQTGEGQEVFKSATDDQGRKLSPEQATATLGDNLRVAASEETRWLALTGSYARPSKLTPMVYQVLQFVALRRGNGRTAVEVGQNFKIDQKAAHHYLKTLDGLGLIVKFSAATKNNTHLVVHRHFLSVSEPYKAATAKDPKIARVAAPRATDDPDGDLYADQDQSALVLSQTLQPPSGAVTPFEGDATPNEHGLTPITYEQVRANKPLVRSRVLKVLRDAPSHVRPQVDIIFAINFRPVDKHNRRYLNTIIKQLGNDGLVQKGVVTTDGHHVGDGKQRSTPCVQLTVAGHEYQETEDQDQEQQGGGQALTGRSDPVQGLDPFLSFGEEERTRRLLYTTPLFKQALNAIFESRGAGMTLRDITAMLRGLDLRLLDQQIQLYERSILPPQLSDFAIHTGRESDGREGRFRFYSITGYVERCLEDGLQVPENVVSKVDETLAGDWASPEGLARFRTLEQLDACTASLPLQGHGKVATAAAKASSSGEPIVPKKRGRPRKNPEQDAAVVTGETAAPKKKGRPRKNPEADTKVASKPPGASVKGSKATRKSEASAAGNVSETTAPVTPASGAAATPSSARHAPNTLPSPSDQSAPDHLPTQTAPNSTAPTADLSAPITHATPTATSAISAPSKTSVSAVPSTLPASMPSSAAQVSSAANTSSEAVLPPAAAPLSSSSNVTQATTLAVNDSPQQQTAHDARRESPNAMVTPSSSLTNLEPSSVPGQSPAPRRQTKTERRPDSHSQRVRENEVLATIQDVGGVIEETPVLIRAHVSYLKKIKNLPHDAKVPSCDKKTMTQTLNGLEYRGLIRRLTVEVSGKTGVPRQQKMVHLPHVTMKSPEMIAFLRTLRTAPAVDYNKPLLEGHNTSAVAAVFLSAKRHHSSHGESDNPRKRVKEGKRTSKSQDGKPRKKRKKRRQDITDENAAVELPGTSSLGQGQIAFPPPQASSQLALMPAPQQAARERSKARSLQVAQQKEKQVDEHGVKLAAAVIKCLTATPQDKYDIESSTKLLQEFDQNLLPKSVLMLQKNGVLVKIDSVGGRRLPGRNFLFSDKFEQALRKSMPSSLLKDAISAADSFMDGSDERLSLMPEDGDMLALLHLVSFDDIELSLDTSLNSDKRDPTDYQTRKLDDESLENTVIVSPREDAVLKRASLERVVKLCDDHATLRGLSCEDAQARLSSLDQHFDSTRVSDHPLSQLLSVFRDASVEGIPCERAERFSPPWKRAIAAGLQVHDGKPPLFASVGFDEPRFILCTPASVAHWAIPHSSESKEERYFPQVWLDIRGRPVYDLVERYVQSVMGVLHTCPGLAVPELCQKLSPVFDHTEMLNLLGMMQQAGLVEHFNAQHHDASPVLASLRSCWRVLPDLQWYLS